MFSVGLFYVSLGILLGLLGFRWLENQELGSGVRYFESVRSWVDTHAERAKLFVRTHFALEPLTRHIVAFWRVVQHYTARLLASLGHMLEHRARRVVHRTARRPRTDHYLAETKNADSNVVKEVKEGVGELEK